MTDKEIKVLLEAAKSLSIDPSTLTARNPWSFKGQQAQALQIAVEAADPIQAAQWRLDSGASMSLQTLAAERGLVDHNRATREDLAQHSPAYQKQRAAEAADWEKRMLSDMETKANDMALRRGANPDDFDKPFAANSWQRKYLAQQADYDNAFRGDIK